MSQPQSEEELISRAVDGDQQALECLLFEHYDRLLAFIAKKIPASRQARISPEDVLQQTFVDIYVEIRAFEPRGPEAFFRWLSTIANHRLLDAIKAEDTAKRGGGRVAIHGGAQQTAESVVDLIDLLSAADMTASRIVARHEAAGALQVGLAGLQEDYRRAIQLHHIEGLEVAQVAEIMDRSPRAVRHLCSRGLEELRAGLGRVSQFLTQK